MLQTWAITGHADFKGRETTFECNLTLMWEAGLRDEL
jgi:hypothetical protein